MLTSNAYNQRLAQSGNSVAARSARRPMPRQTPFVKLSFTARSRKPVFTIPKMRCPYLLLLSGTAARAIAAAEAPRPRGVGPECSTPLPKAVPLV